MEKNYLKLVIVGHVDHGKSTLIGRLLYDTNTIPSEKIDEIKSFCDALGKEIEFGYIMDHLQEEREQGITIDTAQIWFNTDNRNYVIIDAPGHREFVKNMITGASQAEAAILIVDAVEGVQEQTKRHSYILSMLGLTQVIVVINKMDLVSYDKTRFESLKEDIQKFLSDFSIQPSCIIPISAKYGDGIVQSSNLMPWYQGNTLLDSLDTLKETIIPSEAPLRFAVQDVYNVTKRIVVGRIESGKITVGDEILILPSGEKTEVSSIEEFQKNPDTAETGKSIGLTTSDKLFIERGNIICDLKNPPLVSDTISARIFWLDTIPYQKGDRIMFRCTTQEIPCIIESIGKVFNSSNLELIGENYSKIGNREVAEVTIKTEKPVIVEEFTKMQEFGRFVLAHKDICAGGIITGS